VAKHEDLRVRGRGIHPMDANDLLDVPDETIRKDRATSGKPRRARYGRSSRDREFLDPSG
jgi:hypothetical protein